MYSWVTITPGAISERISSAPFEEWGRFSIYLSIEDQARIITGVAEGREVDAVDKLGRDCKFKKMYR